jgi:ferredoxin--NADP+ reductase
MDILAPAVARKAEPGQFIILRVNDAGERIPLTIADFDRTAGTVTIIFQIVGKTTQLLAELNAGDALLDLVGPLGTASHLDSYRKVAVIGGGLGSAIAYPQAKKLFQLGADVDIIAGFRSKDLIILEDEMRAVCSRLFLTTDDGSNGHKGFVSDVLQKLLDEGNAYDLVLAIGPLIMMKVISNLTRPLGIKTVVSMNPVMIDGTGMCGGCRVSVGGETKFACVDGPDFDGHLIDFDLAIRRQQMYKQQEQQSSENHRCRLNGEVHGHG